MDAQTRDQIAAVFLHALADGKEITAQQTAELFEYLRPKCEDGVSIDFESEYRSLVAGRSIVMPRNRDHAEKMLLVAEKFLEHNPSE